MEVIRLITEVQCFIPRDLTAIVIDYLWPKPSDFEWSIAEGILTIKIGGSLTAELIWWIPSMRELAQWELKKLQSAKDIELNFDEGIICSWQISSSFRDNGLHFHYRNTTLTLELEHNLERLTQLLEALSH